MRNHIMMRCQKPQKQQHIGNNLFTPMLRSTAITVITIAVIFSCCLTQTALALPTAEFETHQLDDDGPKFVVIREDVIPDVENTTQKVIRVNPLDIPPIRDDPTGSSDSDLYKIKPILPANRNYVNTKRLRRLHSLKPEMLVPRHAIDNARARPHAPASVDSPIIRHAPSFDGKLQKPKHQQAHKKKKLHFLYNQEALDGRIVGKRMRVHVAPGAYPVYYVVSKTNGRFGKYPIKGFNSEREFQKYLIKSKLEPIALKERFES